MKELESKEIKQLPGSTSQINGIQELYQKRWFCVALLPSGKAYKQDADSPLAFLEVINRALVTWVDLITDEPIKDLAISAAQMGFSEPFIASISAESTLNYQDFDTELWMLPSPAFRLEE